MDTIVKLIRSILIPEKDGLTAGEILREYRELEGEQVPFRSLGFTTLEDFLRASNAFIISHSANGMIVRAKPNEASGHVTRLVREQEGKKKKKRARIGSKPIAKISNHERPSSSRYRMPIAPRFQNILTPRYRSTTSNHRTTGQVNQYATRHVAPKSSIAQSFNNVSNHRTIQNTGSQINVNGTKKPNFTVSRDLSNAFEMNKENRNTTHSDVNDTNKTNLTAPPLIEPTKTSEGIYKRPKMSVMSRLAKFCQTIEGEKVNDKVSLDFVDESIKENTIADRLNSAESSNTVSPAAPSFHGSTDDISIIETKIQGLRIKPTLPLCNESQSQIANKIYDLIDKFGQSMALIPGKFE